ncbi:MAG: DNA recombination/repair protein RecA, partial [Myxococcota bacterium]
QLRQKIGVVFGNPEVTTGGNALKFYATQRVEVRRLSAIKDNGQSTGHRTRIKIVKNKLAPPFREVEVDILYGRGIWSAGDLVDRGIELGVLDRAGAWLSWGEQKLGQGREKVAQALEATPDRMKALREAILARAESTAAASEQHRSVAPQARKPQKKAA